MYHSTRRGLHTEIEEVKKTLIQDCSRHIDMAQAQRFFYQRLKEAAIVVARDCVEHTTRWYTLKCDFVQIMQYTCYSSNQLGFTYYYTPVNVHNFGVVDSRAADTEGRCGRPVECRPARLPDLEQHRRGGQCGQALA